jgi:hypothetical protein
MRLGKKKDKKEKSSKTRGKEKEEVKKPELKPQESKGDVKKESSKPAEVQSPTSPKAADPSAPGPATAKSSTKTLLSNYANWEREKWTLSASEITKGLRSWNFKVWYQYQDCALTGRWKL